MDCDYCDKDYYKNYSKNHHKHSASCNNIRLLLRHGAIPVCKHAFNREFKNFWMNFLFEGFDPNQKNLLLLCFIIDKILETLNDTMISPDGQNELKKRGYKFLQLLLAYGHETKKLLSDNINIPIGEMLGTTYNDDQLHMLHVIFNECKVFIQEEYEFRKSYLENPEQLFLALTKRCRRPDLWIERMSDEMEISLEKQRKLIREICFKTLTLLHETLQGKKNELLKITFPFSYSWDDWDAKSMEEVMASEKLKYNRFIYRSSKKFSPEKIIRIENEKKEHLIYDLLKTIPYMLDNLHKKGMLIFDKEIKGMTTNIMFYGLQKLHEKNDEYKMVMLPFMEYCSKNPHCINWMQKKEGKNIFHLLAYGINNKLLKNIIKNLQEYNILCLQRALKQPMRLTKFSKETHTTPLYIATKESSIDFKCIKTKKLLTEAEYTQYKKTYHHNPYIIDNSYTDILDLVEDTFYTQI